MNLNNKFVKTIILGLISVMIINLATACKPKQKLYVLNWGDYIGETVVKNFEKANPGVDVVYDVFDSNESMYPRLVDSNIPYDVIIPSDYMIEKLAKENRLNKIDMSKITNYSKVGDEFKNRSYDPTNEYSVPYMWGTVGIIYNKTLVTEPVKSWNILWDEKYSGQILMMDSLRDTMSVGLKKLGFSVNTKNVDEINAARDALIAQKPLVAEYGGDTLKDKMISGTYALSVAYSGDAVYMMGENPDLEYVVPDEGSNIWYDAMVIPTTSKNTEMALKFIDFMTSTETTLENVNYICYSTTQSEAFAQLDDSFKSDPVFNPSAEVKARCAQFNDYGDSSLLYTQAWEKIRQSK